MEEAPQPGTFKEWIATEVLPKALGLDANTELPQWAKHAALSACVKPYYYWSQDKASSSPAVHPNIPTALGSSSYSLASAGPAGQLATILSKHPELVLHSGPPGTTLIVPKERLAPDTWEDVHRAAKGAGYAYVPYDKQSGQQGHWKKVTA